MTSQGHIHLTRRQKDVLRAMLNGATAQQIARELTISTATVHTHLRAIYAAFGVRNRTRAVVAAIEAGYGRPSEAVQERWRNDRAQIQSALEDAWEPCQLHSTYQPDCAVCVKAGTVMYAIKLVHNPWVAHLAAPPAKLVVPLRGSHRAALQMAARGPVYTRIQASPPNSLR
ncbi:response regulator transcription factor [Streptomyces sioyaensis]|uniref:response regulator transcription factor n=1 Tax=Streptomyces sioyaensis TaxID=67364 RepID=UPI003D72440C